MTSIYVISVDMSIGHGEMAIRAETKEEAFRLAEEAIVEKLVNYLEEIGELDDDVQLKVRYDLIEVAESTPENMRRLKAAANDRVEAIRLQQTAYERN